MVVASQVKLYLTAEQLEDFNKNLEIFKNCTNWWIGKIAEIKSTNIKKLYRGFYKKSLSVFDIKSDQTLSCLRKAIIISRGSRNGLPVITNGQLYFREKSIKVREKIKLSFGKGVFWVDFKGRIEKGEVRDSIAKKKNGEWYLYLAIKVKEPKEKLYKRCMGVDLGVAKTAVVADWNGKNTRFFGGEPFRFKKNHYRKLRGEMQESLEKGNTYKALKHISKKESNWVTNENHKISREIVNMAIKNKRTIVLEKLTGITERLKVNRKTRKMLKGWSFRQLADFIKYKAKMAGITVLEVDPRGTSKECPKCKHYSRSNRKTQERFKCTNCFYESNADRVGAMNIALRGTELLASR